jgi:hypothetical protein
MLMMIPFKERCLGRQSINLTNVRRKENEDILRFNRDLMERIYQNDNMIILIGEAKR